MGDIVPHSASRLAEDKLRQLQKTVLSRDEYSERMDVRSQRMARRRRVFPTGVDEAAFVGYAEHLYEFKDTPGERRLHLQLDGILPEQCTHVACFPGTNLGSARKFWVVPLVDDVWWVRRLPQELLHADAILVEVVQNEGLSLEVAIEPQVSLLRFEDGKAITGPE